jgi:hypothetical protein
MHEFINLLKDKLIIILRMAGNSAGKPGAGAALTVSCLLKGA